MYQELDSTNIIQFINKYAEEIEDDQLDDTYVPLLLSHYDARINYLAYRVYNSNTTSKVSSVSLAAFKELSKIEIKKSLFTYLFKSEHWRTGRDINTYLLTTLNNLANKTSWELKSAQKVNVPICPGCKSLGLREFLQYEDKKLRCTNCTSETERIEEEIKTCDNSIKNMLESRRIIHKIFQIHSKKGYRCPDCERFIPESYTNSTDVSCPYPDCIFFGKLINLSIALHPMSTVSRNNTSLDMKHANSNTSNNDGLNGYELYADKIKCKEINADDHIEMNQKFQYELSILSEVIELQMERLKSSGTEYTIIQKKNMYQAYKNMLNISSEEMVSYLVHLKQSSEFPIQARIFQEYVRLIKDQLPFQIKKGKDMVDICSLTDPNLGLFEGISKFNGKIDGNYIISNSTEENYIGGSKERHCGPYFIGDIIDIVNKNTGESIKNHIDKYSFAKILMNKDVEINTPVEVNHFRLIPHYEMGNLVYLQRIRRKIVDSVYFKIHGEHREIRRGQD